MKKVVVILLVLALSLSFASCKAEKTIENKTIPAAKTTDSTESAPAAVQENYALKAAREGKVTGLNIGIGSTLQDAVAQLGEPTALDYFEGTSYVSYELVDLILDRIIEDTKAETNITGIILAEGYELYGVKVGMTPSGIKEVLGAPSKEEVETDPEGDMWRLDYDCGGYLLSFFANDKDSPTLSAYLSKKQ